MKCPFCKTEQVQAVNNSVGSHWMFCPTCKASGPHKTNEVDAAAAFVVIPEPQPKRSLFGRTK